MTRTSIGVATCAGAPDLDEDGPLLLAALAEAGADPQPAVWDDPGVDWAGFDLVLVRSTWDYPLRRRAFLRWISTCRQTVNSPEVITWNTDKHYLDDLSSAGVPTVPTTFVPPGSPLPRLPGAVVVKPAVSGSAADTGRFSSIDDAGTCDLAQRLHAQGRTVMVQPYLPAIEMEGETSLVFLGGDFSHAVRRDPLLTVNGERGRVVVADVLSTIQHVEATQAQLETAVAALGAVPGGQHRVSYARVDVIPGAEGPVVLELEATDCFLFLDHATPIAITRFVEHVLTRR